MTTETRSLPLRTREEYRYWKAYARHCARLRPTHPEDFDGARGAYDVSEDRRRRIEADVDEVVEALMQLGEHRYRRLTEDHFEIEAPA